MATREEVKKLAALARLSIDDAELDTFVREFDAILAYVGQLETLELSPEASHERPVLRNVFRSDEYSHAPGFFTEKIVEQFPAHKGDALSVKQIISHD